MPTHRILYGMSRLSQQSVACCIWTERIRQRTAGRVHDGFQSRLWLIAATTYLQLPKCVFQYIDIRRKAIRPQIIFLNIIRNRRGFTDITIGNQPKPKINTSGFQCICKRRKTALDRGNRCSHAACRINQEHDVFFNSPSAIRELELFITCIVLSPCSSLLYQLRLPDTFILYIGCFSKNLSTIFNFSGLFGKTCETCVGVL